MAWWSVSRSFPGKRGYGREVWESKLQQLKSKLEELKSRLQNMKSRLQKAESWLKLSLFFQELDCHSLERRLLDLNFDLDWNDCSMYLELMGVDLEEELGSVEEDMSSREKKFLLEESQLLIIQAMSIFGVSLGSDSMEGPKSLLYKGPIKPSKRANEMRDCNEKLSDKLASLFTEHGKNGTVPVLWPVAAAQEEERKHQATLSERKLRQLVLEMGPDRRGVGLYQHRQRAPLSYQKEFFSFCLTNKLSRMGYRWMDEDLSMEIFTLLEGKTRLEKSQQSYNGAMSISVEPLGSGSMEWPKLLLDKGPTKPGEPASNVETLLMTPEEIRDHNEKLLSRLAPIFTENIKSALRPVLGPVAAALEGERKHQAILLEREEKQLALEICLKRRGVGRPQRRRRASSARRLRPRTRQLGPRLSFPCKR